MSRLIECWACYDFAAPTFKAVVRHIGAVHSLDPNFRITCGVESCTRIYTNFSSFRSHLYRKHRKYLEPVHRVTSDPQDEGMESHDSNNFRTGSDGESSAQCYSDIEKACALFVLKAKEVHKVSQTALNELLVDVTMLIQTHAHKLKLDIQRHLGDMPHSVEGIQGFDLQRLLNPLEEIDPFKGLHSTYLQEKYFKENLGLVEPVERKLGERYRLTRHKERPYLKKVYDFVYDVPLLSSLKQLLSDDFIFEEVMRGHSRNDNLLSDYCDGTAYKEHPLFSREVQSLQLMLYYDELEVCNPLGSKTKTHKIGIFYYTLGNISPQFRSQLKTIQLLCVAKSSVINKYGANDILQTMMNDVILLEEEGITVEGVPFPIRGTVTLVSGDNLGSCFLGGYKAPSRALRKCRHCMATSSDMSTNFVSDGFIPRTRYTHAHHCKALQGVLSDHVATTYGLKFDSVLNSSSYFHTTEGLAPDVMHDVLEGVAQYEVKELLKYLINEKLLSLSDLNAEIEHFPYSYADVKDKPTPIVSTALSSTDHNIKQKAAQMWCFCRLLPLMIGNRVPSNDERWGCFLLLLKIIDYLMAPLTSHEITSYLRTLLEDHHNEFKKLYPLCSVVPKLHYMIHYPEWMSRCGPLVRFWCMRYEAKHNYFKSIAQRTKCFRNIPKTLAKHHQRFLCLYMNSNHMLGLLKEDLSGPIHRVCLQSLAYCDAVMSLLPDIAEDSYVNRLGWIQLHGTVYKPGGAVVLQMNLYPTFGRIHDLIVFNVNNYYIVCEELITEAFNNHYHAYEVALPNPRSYIICKPSDLVDHTVLGIYHRSTSLLISLKYHLVEHV